MSVLASGPGDEYVAAAAEGVPEVAKGDEADDVLLAGGSGIARAAECGDGGGDGAGGGGGGDGVGGDKPEYGGADGGVRVRERGVGGEMEGWDRRGVWWGGPTPETGSAQLYRDMFGVVVVRDRHRPCWVLAESHTRCGRHWDSHSDHFLHVHCPHGSCWLCLCQSKLFLLPPRFSS